MLDVFLNSTAWLLMTHFWPRVLMILVTRLLGWLRAIRVRPCIISGAFFFQTNNETTRIKIELWLIQVLLFTWSIRKGVLPVKNRIRWLARRQECSTWTNQSPVNYNINLFNTDFRTFDTLSERVNNKIITFDNTARAIPNGPRTYGLHDASGMYPHCFSCIIRKAWIFDWLASCFFIG